jgi:hypothetical protein
LARGSAKRDIALKSDRRPMAPMRFELRVAERARWRVAHYEF